MKISDIIPQTPGQVADWSDMAELQQRMAATVTAMSQIASDVGMAKTVIEFNSDRRKRALARGCSAALAGGDSVAKAECESRASESYGKELVQLQKEYAAAEQSIMEWETLKIAWSTCQSLLAMQRESVKRI